MSATSNNHAYCYAKFLVDISPEDAINILWEGSARGDIKLDERVDQACVKLGGGSINAIKGMIEARQWDELKDLRQSPTPSAMTPRDYRLTVTGQTMPPTPSSTASGSPLSRRRSEDWIWVYHMAEHAEVPVTIRLMAKPSGSEHYLIGEDKLKRFEGLTKEWITHPEKVLLGGQWIEVAASVSLTWNRHKDSGTMYEKFWVVRPGLIRNADVLLGHKDQQYRIRRDKAVNSSPPLDSPDFCQAPAVPTPPQHQRFHQPSSTAIYSHSSSPQGSGQAIHNDLGMPNHQPPWQSAGTDTMTSGSRPSYESVPSRSMMEGPPSRPQSASSIRTARPFNFDKVLVHLSFQGKGKKILALDLTKSGDEIVPYLEPHISRLSGQDLDRSVHELTITPLRGTEAESQSSSLSEEEFDLTWDAMVEFMRENRAAESKKPEFHLDIG